jgi:hypothetical protein
MSKRLRFLLPALLVVAAFAVAPAAFARSHWSVGVNLGFPGVSIGYADYGHRGHGWGGNYYGGYGGYAGYYGGHHAPVYYRPAYYGPTWYGPTYYGPRYYGYGGSAYYSRPVGSVVYYDHEPRRHHRRVELHDGYRDRPDDGYRDGGQDRRASYYDRDADYRR